MRIAYVARHGGHGNDDEGAVAYALTQLGHEVILVHEADALVAPSLIPEADFLLFHKWAGAGVETSMPKVFFAVICFAAVKPAAAGGRYYGRR